MQGNDSRRAAWLAVLVVLLLLIAGGVAFLTLGGEDEAKAQTVRFQAPTDTGPDPFTAPADVRGRRVEVGSGPFGGTGSDLVCDRELLIRSLAARPDRMREWARVLGVETDARRVARYIRKLRPVTLTPRHAGDQPLVRQRPCGGASSRSSRRAPRCWSTRTASRSRAAAAATRCSSRSTSRGRVLRLPAELPAAAALRVLRLRRP